MQTLTQLAPLRELVHGWKMAGERIAFVPTMGNLHSGHASLLGAAHLHGRRVIASVFVNPLQFGPSEDYTAYPRTPDEDAEILEGQGVDALFRPSVEEMYPDGSEQTAYVEVPGITDILCGEFRPGHFRGVATVVVKLLNLVQPDVAIFRREGLPAARGRYAGNPRALAARQDRRCAYGPRRGWPRAELAQPLPERRGTCARAADLPVARRARRRLEAGDADVMAIEEEGRETLTAAGLRVDYFEVRRQGTLERPHGRNLDVVVLTAARLVARA
jgi:pantoate--beta-alanine ligase